MPRILLVLLFAPMPALAYIDPSTGGALWFALSPILAMIISAWLFMKERVAAAIVRLKRILARVAASRR